MLKFVDYYLQRRIEAPFQKVGEQQFYEDQLQKNNGNERRTNKL